MIQKKHGLLCITLFCQFLLLSHLFADSFSEGEQLFSRNKPQEAILLFEQAMLSPTVNSDVYNFLGLSYYQIGKTSKALETFLKGTTITGTNKRILYYNAGNAAFAMGLFSEAENYYSLSSVADPSFAQAFLNRANARLKLDKLSDASVDYVQYLSLYPQSSQAEQIRRVIELLSAEIENRKLQEIQLAQEAERLKEEETRISQELATQNAEAERLAAEKAAVEAERRKKLMEEIAASLQNTESTNISAGSEGVMEYTYESELD